MSISPIKVNFKLEDEPEPVKKKRYKGFLFALVFGLIGALLNSFSIELTFNISLILGNLVFIVAAAYLRPSLTLLTALIATAPLIIIWGHPFGFISFGLEAIFVSYLRSRGWYLATADFLYWLVLGMPLTAALIWFNNSSPQDILLFSIFKQCINAIFYTALAVIVILIFDARLKSIVFEQPVLTKNLNQYLHHVLWIMSAFFAVGVSLLLSRNISHTEYQLFEQELKTSSDYIGRITETYVGEHKSAIAVIANSLSYIPSEFHNQILVENHKAFPGFLTMLTADKHAIVNGASPLSLLDKLSNGSFSIADRPYFIRAFYQQELFISSVFLGRGFGADPIVAISAPVYESGNKSPTGIVEGSLNLNMFDHINIPRASDVAHVKIIIVDENENIIYSDKSLALKTLSSFNYVLDHEESKRNLLSIESRTSQIFLHHEVVLNNGWKVFALVDHSEILHLIEQQYLTIFASLFVIFALVIILASQFSKLLYKPLDFIIRDLTKEDILSQNESIPYEAPTEFNILYKELLKGKKHLLEQQYLLEETVSKRTKALNEANETLKTLADTDSLTKLSNRRHLGVRFAELQAILSRNNAQLIVAMLDIDYFKRLNDTYGHINGDHCLVDISRIMKEKFDRRSDIVARFGGEEFVIVTQGDDSNKVLSKFEKLRQEIEQHHFVLENKEKIMVTVSIGIVCADSGFDTELERWLHVADECLYQAKDNGRNRVKIKLIS